MIPYWNSDVTLYRKTVAVDGNVSWSRSVHNKCFWQQKNTISRNEGAEFKNASIVCRMPVPYPDVRIGDILVFGNVSDVIDEYKTGKRSADVLAKYAGKSMVVTEVRANTRGMPGLDHLYAGG